MRLVKYARIPGGYIYIPPPPGVLTRPPHTHTGQSPTLTAAEAHQDAPDDRLGRSAALPIRTE